MNTFDSYHMLITPLSPIHVGTGESYEPTNYVIEEGALHEFDTGAVMAALTEAERGKLLGIASSKPNPDMIEAVQRFFYERREILMGHAIQRIPVLPGVAGFYARRVGQTANREADGKKVLNRLEIDRTSFNPVTRMPLLFGSSIKGAIRTALLDKENGGARLLKVDDHGKRRDERNQELQNRLFKFSPGKFELDPMRLVQLADAAWSGEPGLPAAQIHLAVNRKKVEVKDKQGLVRKSQAETKDLYQILECIPGWRYRAFTGQLNLQSVAGIPNQGRNGKPQLPATELRFSAKQIAAACNAFYKPILQDELTLMRERNYLGAHWDKAMQQLLAATRDKMHHGNAFLLRVGRHSGAESVTLNGVRQIKIMKGKGEQPEYLDAAKTLWFAADDKDQATDLLPFGWLLVELQPINAAVLEWPELKSVCEPHLSAARVFADRLANQQARLEQIKLETEAKRHEEQEQARIAEEAEARRGRDEEARKARLSSLAPNLRRIEEFKADYATRTDQLRGGKDRQNTEFHQRAQKLSKDALEGADWTTEEKHAAADAIAEWLPKVIDRIDKDALKKLKLNALRGNP